MITGKRINIFIICIMIAAIVLTGVWMAVPGDRTAAEAGSQPEYASKLFGENSIISIDIKADAGEWQNMLDNATKEEYISCDVTINGITYQSVGIRPKGNSSLSSVANSDSDRFSFKFEFDHYIEGQTCFGLDKLVINNVQSDATYMKDYLSYDLMAYMGVKTPLFAYSSVKVNGEDWGFYIAVEAMEEAFAQRNFGSGYGMLYKPESMGARGNGNMKEFVNDNANLPDDKNRVDNHQDNNNQNNNQEQPGFERGGFGGGGFGSGGSSGGTDLKYTDDSIGSYSNIFDNQVFDGTTSDYNRVIKALKNLNSGTDLEKYINVDEMLRYFAVNTVLVNMDSYFSSMKHNYYLYEKDGRLTMLPWDYNLAFGGFQSGTAASAVNFPIDTPVSGVDMAERPMLSKLLEVEEYSDKYHEYLQQILDGYFNNGTFEGTVNSVDALIKDYVKNDASAFYTFEQYQKAVQMIKEFGSLRAESIQGQLDGIIPSTSQGQSDAGDKLIDASTVNLSVMGSQGGGGGAGRFGGMEPQNGKQPPGDTLQEGQEPPGQQEQQEQAGLQEQPENARPDGMGEGRGHPEQGQFDGAPLQQGGFIPGEQRAQQNSAGFMTYRTQFAIIGASILCLLAGLLYVIKFRRNKFI